MYMIYIYIYVCIYIHILFISQVISERKENKTSREPYCFKVPQYQVFTHISFENNRKISPPFAMTHQYMVHNIVPKQQNVIILSPRLSHFTIWLLYMITISFHHMVRIFLNIVKILAIFTILCHNIVHHIVKFDTIVDSIVTMCRLYCEIFRRGLLMKYRYFLYNFRWLRD